MKTPNLDRQLVESVSKIVTNIVNGNEPTPQERLNLISYIEI